MNKISLNPSIHWLILFFLFAFGNALLAYAVLDLFFKALILGAMILLFFGIILGKVQLNELRRENLTQTEFRFPIWTGTLIASLAVFSRFFKLTTLRLWPNSDEALQGFFAIDLLDRWNWRFFILRVSTLPCSFGF